VTVRWTTALPDADRAGLERRFSLLDGQPHSSRSDDLNLWNYGLTELSTGNLKALVTDPHVLDTNGIDRTAFSVEPQPPRTDHPFLAVAHVRSMQYPGMLFFLTAAAFVGLLGFIAPAALTASPGAHLAERLAAAAAEPFRRRAVPFLLFLIPLALWTARPSLSPLALAPVRPSGRVATPKAMVTNMGCITVPSMPARFAEEFATLPERMACPPDYRLVEWVRTNVPVDAVFAIDRWDPFPPSMFMPQQVVVFPTLDASFIDEDELFRDYYRVFGDRMRRYHVQPFFNDVETPGERAAFTDTLGVTHVLVNPANYRTLRPVLDALPGQFTLRYSAAQWAVYEVRREPVAR
jgi:hypothetical protein